MASVTIAAIFAALSTLTPKAARIAIVRIPVPLAVSPPMSAITITADASAAATPITSPAPMAPASDANAPIRPAIPASHPMTIATGMNANNAGDTSNPSTLLDTMPVDDAGPWSREHRNENGPDGIEVHGKLERTDDGAQREVERDRARNQRERERRERTSGRKGHRRITYYS